MPLGSIQRRDNSLPSHNRYGPPQHIWANRHCPWILRDWYSPTIARGLRRSVVVPVPGQRGGSSQLALPCVQLLARE